MSSSSPCFSTADQLARFAQAKAENNRRFLDISSVYDAAFVKGKRVAITGANRGIGLALAREVVAQGGRVIALVRTSSPALDALPTEQIVTGVNVTDNTLSDWLPSKITGGPIDILINNAGYFYEPVETLTSLNFEEELSMIDICAVGPLRVTAALLNAGLLGTSNSEAEMASRVIVITSQGGSIAWRTTQNPTGGDYGHHMSKAAANMGAALLAQEVRPKGVAVGILHPGFNKTEMTAKYTAIWEAGGAVDAAEGAKRVLHEVGRVTLETSGKFINCEDGKEIPW